MTTRSDLIGRGYFPKELPPPFYTSDYSTKLFTNPGAIPPTFSEPDPRTSKMVCHSMMRVGNLRRPLRIPNPISYYGLTGVIEDCWLDIDHQIRLSSLSKSIPTIDTKNVRALVPASDLASLLPIKAAVRAKSRYILRTDISRFYPSVYSHSISWALHTKPTAKAHKNNPNLLGNRLDKWVRNSQDGQTIGIPIGPDTSLVIAELIMSDIDNKLLTKNPTLIGFRFVDDYELGFKSMSEAEETLALLQEELRFYELELNPQKTELLELPQALESQWVPTLRDFEFSDGPRRQRSNIPHFFDMSFRFSQVFDKDSVLKYAVRKVIKSQCDPENWELLQSYLIQCIMVEPSTISNVIDGFLKYQREGHELDINTLGGVLNFLIYHHSILGHCSEVAWALWAMIVFGIHLKKEVAERISKVQDSVTALLALDAHSQDLIPEGLNTDLWEIYMDSDELYGDQWLLSYEASVKGWLHSRRLPDHVSVDPNFSFLKAIGVEFYNSQRVIDAIPETVEDSDIIEEY